MKKIIYGLVLMFGVFVLASCVPEKPKPKPPTGGGENTDEKPGEKPEEEKLVFSFYFKNKKIVIELEEGEKLLPPEIETEDEHYYWETSKGEIAEFEIVYKGNESFFYKTSTQFTNYLVYFEIDGEIEHTFETMTNGKLYKLPEIPQKEGYITLGWADVNGVLVDINKIYRTDTILNAKYEEDQDITIKVNFFDSNFNLIEEIELNSPDTVIAPEPEEISGFEFIGWFDNKGAEYDSESRIEKNTNFYSRYKEIGNVRITLSEYGVKDRVLEVKSNEKLSKPTFRSIEEIEDLDHLVPTEWITEYGKIFDFNQPIERSVKLSAYYEFKVDNSKAVKAMYNEALANVILGYRSEEYYFSHKYGLFMGFESINAILPGEIEPRLRFMKKPPVYGEKTWNELNLSHVSYNRLIKDGKPFVVNPNYKYFIKTKKEGVDYLYENNKLSFFKVNDKGVADITVHQVGRLFTDTLAWFSPEIGNNTSGHLKILGKATEMTGKLKDPYQKFGKNAYIVSAPGMNEYGHGAGLTIFDRNANIVGSFSRTEKAEAKDGTTLNVIYLGVDSQNEQVVNVPEFISMIDNWRPTTGPIRYPIYNTQKKYKHSK